MVQALTDDQKMVARAFGGWHLAALLVNPDTKSLPGWPWVGGSSHPRCGEPGEWLDYDAKSIRLGPVGGTPRIVVPWARIRIHARSLPDYLVRQLRYNMVARGSHQQAYTPFAASKEAVGCGRLIEGQEPTPAQVLYAEEVKAWHTQFEVPHRARSEELKAEMEELLDEAMETDNLCRCEAMRLPHITTPGLCVGA